jgi:glutamyl-tRNA synthetase
MSKEDLIERFTLERVRPAPAGWDYDKLNRFNGIYIRNLPPEELAKRLIPFLMAAKIKVSPKKFLSIIPLIQNRLNILSDVTSWVDFFFVEDLPNYDISLLVPKKLTLSDAIAILQHLRKALANVSFTHDTLEETLKAIADEVDRKPRDIFHSLRVAVCGKQVAPPFPGVLEILGKNATLKRIDAALARVAKKN